MKGCHCHFETEGTWRKSHWPALYLKEGLLNWISTTSGFVSGGHGLRKGRGKVGLP